MDTPKQQMKKIETNLNSKKALEHDLIAEKVGKKNFNEKLLILILIIDVWNI